jgi:large subunit ribosomal protein L24
MMTVQKIRKNDTVIVIAGNDKGKTGVVQSVDSGRIVVQGINVKNKSIRPNPQTGEKGGHRSVERSIDISNVALYDTQSKEKVRVAVKTLDDGSRVRVNKKTGKTIDGEAK